MNINIVVAETLESSAEWRREKASEHPDDAKRNNDASDALEALAVLFRNEDTDEDILAEYAEMFDDDSSSLSDPVLAIEAQNRVINAIGSIPTMRLPRIFCRP